VAPILMFFFSFSFWNNSHVRNGRPLPTLHLRLLSYSPEAYHFAAFWEKTSCFSGPPPVPPPASLFSSYGGSLTLPTSPYFEILWQYFPPFSPFFFPTAVFLPPIPRPYNDPSSLRPPLTSTGCCTTFNPLRPSPFSPSLNAATF